MKKFIITQDSPKGLFWSIIFLILAYGGFASMQFLPLQIDFLPLKEFSLQGSVVLVSFIFLMLSFLIFLLTFFSLKTAFQRKVSPKTLVLYSFVFLVFILPSTFFGDEPLKHLDVWFSLKKWQHPSLLENLYKFIILSINILSWIFGILTLLLVPFNLKNNSSSGKNIIWFFILSLVYYSIWQGPGLLIFALPIGGYSPSG